MANGMKIFLGIALAIILFGVFNLGVSTFYPSPDYEDFCDRIPPTIELQNDTQIKDVTFQCQNEYETAKDNYNNIIFYVFVIAGLLFAVSGLFITNLSFQIVGLVSGTALIIEGILRNLENKIPAFIAGVFVFGILSYFVWRKVK